VKILFLRNIKKQRRELKKYLIELADSVLFDVEMHEFHVDGERHQDETGVIQ